MKRRVLFVENYAKVEKVIAQDLTNDFDIDERAARIMRLVSGAPSFHSSKLSEEHFPRKPRRRVPQVHNDKSPTLHP